MVSALMDYRTVYSGNFLDIADGIADWKLRKLKYGDALAAVGYAFGVPSLDALREILPFPGVGRDTVADGVDALSQCEKILAVRKREPRGFLEIGTGRGEVAVSLDQFGYAVQAIEPSAAADRWLTETAQHFFGKTKHAVKLINVPAHLALEQIDWALIDTVIMVESVEHIMADDFTPVHAAIREHLGAVGGRFILTNWLDYHPIHVGWYAAPEVHCRHVDDALYDAWAKEAKSVFYRNGSHLVLDY